MLKASIVHGCLTSYTIGMDQESFRDTGIFGQLEEAFARKLAERRW